MFIAALLAKEAMAVKKVAVALMAMVMLMAFAVPAMAAEQEEVESQMDSAIERAEAYLDSIDVEEIKEQFQSMGDFFDMLLSGAPGIVMAVLAFGLLFMVLRKVLGR